MQSVSNTCGVHMTVSTVCRMKMIKSFAKRFTKINNNCLRHHVAPKEANVLYSE